jgi:hypothetical protein
LRDSLLVADPGIANGQTTQHNHGGTPSSVPPSIWTATNVQSGDTFDSKLKDAFHLSSANANEISSKDGLARTGSPSYTPCVLVKSKFVDAVALQEPNTDFMQPYIRQKYQEMFKEHFGQAEVLTATACIDAPISWKPGRVVLAILGSWEQHVTQVSCDDLGGWVLATLTGSNINSITIYSVYNVMDVKLHAASPSAVFSQQYQLLRLAGVTFPNPQQQCVEDLKQAVAKSVANQEAVIIIGECNKQLGRPPNLMASVFATNDLFDVHACTLGFTASRPTSPRMSVEPHVSTIVGPPPGWLTSCMLAASICLMRIYILMTGLPSSTTC